MPLNAYLLAGFFVLVCRAVAYDPLDPTGHVSIKWDVLSWTTDGYIAMVTINNRQMFRHVSSPGWTVGWTWSKQEVIWSTVGGQPVDQGDCSDFQNSIPQCCKKSPNFIDLLPGASYRQQVTNCCKSGILSSSGQDPDGTISAFQVSVGLSGNTKGTVRLPKNFTMLGPGPGYTCGPAVIIPSSVSLSPDGRAVTRAMMTWQVTCTYSKFVASKTPACCVSISSFYDDKIIHCPSCACGCSDESNCEKGKSVLECTQHMCPIRVHWHVKKNYRQYWRVKISVTNYMYGVNYTQWTLVAQHPNFNKIAQVSGFVYKPIFPYASGNDTGMFFGIRKLSNEVLMEAGVDGYVHTELILEKDVNLFTLKQGWAFPRKIYFDGDECIMPPPDLYPQLPNSAHLRPNLFAKLHTMMMLVFFLKMRLCAM